MATKHRTLTETEDHVKYGDYAVLWDKRDVDGEFFTKATEFGTAQNLPVYLEHGMDPVVGIERIGVTTNIKADDRGLWIDRELDKRVAAYEQRVKVLIERGLLGDSTGSLAHLTRYGERKGGVREIKHWPLGEVSLVTTPAQPLQHTAFAKAADDRGLCIKALHSFGVYSPQPWKRSTASIRKHFAVRERLVAARMGERP